MAHDDKDPMHQSVVDAADVYDTTGSVKWFDPVKGFGFVVPDDGGSDILLHINVLRNFGQSSIADGAQVELRAHTSEKGLQAIELLAIEPPILTDDALLCDLNGFDPAHIIAAPTEPARVKWFDKSKGFGFANVFGRSEDIFLHVDVLRRSGLSDVQPGEAIALKVLDGKRGKMAAKVQAWETIGSEQGT